MPAYDNNPLCLVAESVVHGNGLFARLDIPSGTWIGRYDGEEITIDYGEEFAADT